MDQTAREFAWQFVGYRPSPEQLAAHLDPSRMKLVAGGERAGKSYSAAMELYVNVIGSDQLFWIVSADYAQARPEFTYVHEALMKCGMVKSSSIPKVGQCQVETVFGGTIMTKSADDVRKLAGVAPSGILLCEAAQCDYEVWLKLRGRLTEKRAWLWMSGTFEGSLGWYPQLFNRWQAANPEGGRSFSIPTWANLAIFPGGRNDPEILALERTYPADLFLERCAAIPCKPVGLVFQEFSFDTHVSAAARYDPALPVELAIDPGFASAYAIEVCQVRDKRVYVIDEIYESGKVAEEMIAICKKRPWWRSVRGGVIDVAGKQHPGAKSQIEIWQHEAGVYLRANRVSVVDGILRTRTYLLDPGTGEPQIFFNPVCKGILAEFGKYKYAKTTENRPETELPLDRDNHGLKCIAYYLYDKFGPVYRRRRKPTPGRNPFGDDEVQAPDIEIARGETGVRFVKQTPARATALTFEDET